MFLKQNVDLDNQYPHYTEKKTTKCLSLFGEGQTVLSINRLNQGEVRPARKLSYPGGEYLQEATIRDPYLVIKVR